MPHILVFIYISLFAISLSAQSIILTEQNSTNGLAEVKGDFDTMLQKSELLNKLHKSEKFNLKIDKQENRYVVSVENLQTAEDLSTMYLTLKEFFPNAIIQNSSTPATKQPMASDATSKLTKQDEGITNIDILYLVVIFLLISGIIVAILIFRKIIDKLKNHHHSEIKKHQKVEIFLTQTGEKIHSITHEISEDKKENNQRENFDSVKNRLFDETRMMIYFLKLKSKKIEIVEENFNINTMLSNILGALSSNFTGVQTELIFDIDRNMPKIVTSDLLHMTEIITELLQNSIVQTPNGQLKLSMTILENDMLFIKVADTSTVICQESQCNIANIFTPTYRDDGTPERLGLYIASELTTLLGGTLEAKHDTPCGLIIECKIPVVNPFPDEMRKYRLPDLSYIKKRVLLCEKNRDAAKAIEKMLNYFKYKVDIFTCDKSLSEEANMISYDLVMGDIVNLSAVDIYTIEKYRKKNSLKVVNLSSVFQKDDKSKKDYDYIDEWLKKPLSQERLYDLIILLFDEDGEISMNAKAKNSVDNMKILSIEERESLSHITVKNLEKFRHARILIADDSSIDQRILKHILIKGEMEITLAKNGVEALERLYRGGIQYDLVFMDISMPIMDGYEAMRHIRENEKFATLPLVATTSVTLESEINKIFRYGANAYIEKPLSIPALYATLNFFLSGETIEMMDDTSKQVYPQKILHNIVGLDYKRGIRNANNSEELYSEILSEFVLAYGDSTRVIHRILDEDRHQQFKRLCLDLRSLTNAIGAYDMFSVVDTIYKQYIYNNIYIIHQHIELYDNERIKLLKSIEEYKAMRSR